MSFERSLQLRNLEGLRVSVALSDRSRIDDCQLVSAGRSNMRTVWVYSNGLDVFLQMTEILEIWESGCLGRVHAA